MQDFFEDKKQQKVGLQRRLAWADQQLWLQELHQQWHAFWRWQRSMHWHLKLERLLAALLQLIWIPLNLNCSDWLSCKNHSSSHIYTVNLVTRIYIALQTKSRWEMEVHTSTAVGQASMLPLKTWKDAVSWRDPIGVLQMERPILEGDHTQSLPGTN